jgi:hypothetical protein
MGVARTPLDDLILDAPAAEAVLDLGAVSDGTTAAGRL